MGAVTHTMKWEKVPGALGTNSGYVLCYVEQATDASVADNDILTFKNVQDVQALFMQSEVGLMMDFDAVGTTAGKQYTVLTTTAATYIKGLALIKE
jgi:uncharacterized protein related to proFAR isomerase